MAVRVVLLCSLFGVLLGQGKLSFALYLSGFGVFFRPKNRRRNHRAAAFNLKRKVDLGIYDTRRKLYGIFFFYYSKNQTGSTWVCH